MKSKEVKLDILKVLEEIKQTSDITWGLYSFSKEPLKDRFSDEEKIELIKKAILCGENHALEYKEKYKKHGILKILEDFNVKFENVDEENTGSQVIFAQYIEPDKIEVFDLHLKTTLKKFEQMNIEFKHSSNLKDILVSHELFHVIEFFNKEKIFTRTFTKRLWKIPFYEHKSKVLCLSEIAAMSFTKKLLDLDYNPFMLDILMVYPYNEFYANDLYENLKKIEADNVIS